MQPIFFCAVLVIAVLFVQMAAAAILQRQEQSICQANLRSLVLAVHRYAEDHQGQLPNAVDNTLPRWRWWTDEVFPYMDSIRSFYCPEKAPDLFTRAGTSPLLPVIWDHSLLSYGMNYRLGTAHGRDPQLKLAEIETPEAFFVFAESNHYLVRTHPSMWSGDIAPRHEGRVNAAFLDGHVDSYSLDPHQAPRNSGDGIYNLKQWQLSPR